MTEKGKINPGHPQVVSVEKGDIQGKARWRVYFMYNSQIVHQIKQIQGAYFSGSEKCWLLPGNQRVLAELKALLGSMAEVKVTNDLDKPGAGTSISDQRISEGDNILLERFRSWMEHRRYRFEVYTRNTEA